MTLPLHRVYLIGRSWQISRENEAMDAAHPRHKPSADSCEAKEAAAKSIGLIAMGLGRFRVMTEHEHRLAWERHYRGKQ